MNTNYVFYTDQLDYLPKKVILIYCLVCMAHLAYSTIATSQFVLKHKCFKIKTPILY